MKQGFWPLLLIVVAVVAYVVVKVIYYMRRSEQQWSEVDRSKLRAWEDEEP